MESLQRVFSGNRARGWPLPLCASCGTAIIASSSSEHVNDRCVRNVWSCDVCGYEFETATFFSAPTPASS
jgi:ribosomal protein L37AE/L43A